MYCLDTSIIVDIFRGDGEVIKKVNSLWKNEIFVTPISISELYKGAYGHKNYKSKIKTINEFIDNIKTASLDKNSAKEFGFLWQNLKKKGKMINDFDILIASIVKSNNLTLVTRDSHFKNTGIKTIII